MDAPVPHPPAARDLVVIGASAGGVETLKRVVANLPENLAATVCIVLHISPDAPSMLAKILGRSGPLPSHAARDGEPLRYAEILVAPPDRHLVVEDGLVHLSVGPRENGHRPAADVLFRSAAEARGSRVIGVILSGTRGDGAIGLAAIKAGGGVTIVQDPHEALYPGMPATALEHVAVDAVVPTELVAKTIVAMVNGKDPAPMTDPNEPEVIPSRGESAVTVCPECGGVLTERTDAGMPTWECRVGHRYSPEGLLDTQAFNIEASLWAAIRALEDRNLLLERMASQSEARGLTRSARRFRDQARAAEVQALAVREALSRAETLPLSKSEADEVEGEPRTISDGETE